MFTKKQINIAVLMALAWPGAVTVAQAETNSVKAPTVQVIGTPEALERIPGSGEILDKQTLESSRVFTANEALRKLPGINVRDEEGFGLRPNIGIRGLNPTRSTKITLLEDGVPLSYAPYGDNASYYHPPIDRYERIEVLKGAGQILYGPQTIGGVINYITPTPPARPGGSITLSGGNRDYLNGHVNYGGTWGSNGLLFDYIRKQGDGARDNTHSELNDANFKAVVGLGAQQALTLRANYYSEDSNVTYSGLTQAEFNNLGARYNPFKNDFMYANRYGASATHEFVFNDDMVLTTNLYGSIFLRDWWRQSSITTETMCGTAFRDARLAGSSVDPDTCNANQGRLREYYTWGIEPRLRVNHNLLGVSSEADLGMRAHYETQERIQMNGTSPTARTGTTAEDNLRETDAYAVFAQNRFLLGDWTLTPGLRFEYIDSLRTNNLSGVTGSDTLGQWIPSLGGTYSPGNALTVFAGVHRGFAPPRTEDVIGSTGTSTDVGPELSVNWEMGLRAEPMAGTNLQATLFRNDFSNQIAVGSIAGGSTPLAQGETLYQGLELSGRTDMPAGMYLRGAYTWLPTAEQTTPFTQVVNGNLVSGSADGNRLPYAPKHLLTAALGYAMGGLDMQLEGVYVGEQFSDFANTAAASANGQTGLISGYTVWNATLNYHFKPERTTVFLTVKNLADKTYIVDRTRGILPGSPRLVQAGIKYAF